MTEPQPTTEKSAGLKLRITFASGAWLGPGKADLLEGIRDTGSIAAAGRRMGMSYKRAWGLIETLNAMFREPLVLSARGGAAHGGASLTDTGIRVLALYRVAEAQAAAAAGASMAELYDMSAGK